MTEQEKQREIEVFMRWLEKPEEVEQYLYGFWHEAGYCWYRDLMHRVKPTPKPVPWEQADVPPGCYIRKKGSQSYSSVTEISPDGVIYGHTYFVSWNDLADKYENSTDLKTWQPCTK